VIFHEAFINGMLVTALVVFYQIGWKRSRTRYLAAPWKDEEPAALLRRLHRLYCAAEGFDPDQAQTGIC
jgi:hypothetical protein